MAFHRSTFCQDSDCVEVEATRYLVRVRNSRHPYGPTLTFTWEEWETFISGIEGGDPKLTGKQAPLGSTPA